MKGCGCIGAAVAIAIACGGIGAITWYTDTCTLYVGGRNANLTLQGWGSGSACRQAESSSANEAFSVVRVLTLGAVDASLHEGAPSGDVVCDGWDGHVRYTVRDYGITGLNVVGQAWCSQMPH